MLVGVDWLTTITLGGPYEPVAAFKGMIGITLLDSIKMRSAIAKARRELSSSGKTGLALYDYIQECTRDSSPWIKNPIGIFYYSALNCIVIANQKTGAVTLLYK